MTEVIDRIEKQESLTTTIEIAHHGGNEIPRDVDRIVAKHDHKVCWHVHNQTDETCTVSLRDFRVPGKPPKHVAVGLHDVEVEPGATRDIEAKANKDGETQPATYKYDIWLRWQKGPWHNAKDPDYEVWP